jgi:glycosyltransferase involved in cell wall biosynthesis
MRGLPVSFVAGTLGQGGAERQLFYVVKTLAEHGAKPRVLSLTRGEFWEARIQTAGVPVTWVGRGRSRLIRLLAIVRALRSQRPAVVQSQHFYTNLYAVAAARTLGVAELGAIRCNTNWEVEDLGGFGGLSLRMPRVIAANSQAAIANAVALGVAANRLRFLPNVVDTAAFAPAAPHSNGVLRILSVGRRVPQKRFDRFLSVLSAVRQRSTRPVRGVLVTTGGNGDGDLERQARELGLGPESIEFRGPVADTAALYRDADIFLLTSDWEGTPNVVLEAMASAMPVVATSVGGVPEIVRHADTGYLVDPADENAIVDAILTLADDDGSRVAMGRRARAYVEERHSVRRLPQVLRDLYETMAA